MEKASVCGTGGGFPGSRLRAGYRTHRSTAARAIAPVFQGHEEIVHLRVGTDRGVDDVASLLEDAVNSEGGASER